MAMTKRERETVTALERELAEHKSLRFPTYPEPKPINPESISGSYDDAIRAFALNVHTGSVYECLLCSQGYKELSKDGKTWQPEHGWRGLRGQGQFYKTLVDARRAYRYHVTREVAKRLVNIDTLITELEAENV